MDRQQLLQASVLCSRTLRANIESVDSPNGRPRSLLRQDFSLAAGGLMRIGEFQAVRDTLDSILPTLLDSPSLLTRITRTLLGTKTKEPYTLVISSACRYAREADQPAWAGLVQPKLEQALAAATPSASSNFMTQLQYWKALTSLSDLLRWLGRTREGNAQHSEATAFARRIDDKFWDETRGFYCDSPRHPNLSCDSNLSAVVLNFAPAERNARIVRAIDRAGLWTETVTKRLGVASLGLRVLKMTKSKALLNKIFSKTLLKLESGKPSAGDAGMLLEAFHELLTSDEVSCELQ